MAVVSSPNGGVGTKTRIGSATQKGIAAAANHDKQVVTNWYTAGIEYMFNREWGNDGGG